MNKKPIISKIKKEDLTKSKHSHLLKGIDKDVIEKVDYVEFTENNGFVSVRVIFKNDKKREDFQTSHLLNKETQFDKNSDVTIDKNKKEGV